MSKPIDIDRLALRKIGFWMNRTNDAWNMGEADWAKGPDGDVLSKIANEFIERNDIAGGLVIIEAICKEQGIDPKLHKGHRVG